MKPAGAMFWEFRRRIQWGVAAYAIWVTVFMAIKLLIAGDGYPVRLDPPNGMAAFLFVPTTFLVFYLVGVFTHGLSGDLATRHSIYPARLFTLPVSTAGLAFWPMCYAAASAVTVWLMFTAVMRVAGATFHLPLVWPALMLAAYFAWMQALMWMPYGLPGLRVMVAVIWLFAFDAAVIAAFTIRVPEILLVTIVAAQLPLAFIAATLAIARARRGDVPDWRVKVPRPSTTLNTGRISRAAFSSPGHAQAWFEWRLRGRALPASIAMLLPFLLWLLFIPGKDPSVIVTDVLLLVLLVPPVLAFFSASTVSAPTPFVLTKPLTTPALIRAKLIAMLWSAVIAWVVVLILVPVALALAGRWSLVSDVASRAIRFVGPARAIAIPALVLAVLIASTWRQLVQNLCIGLSGRPRLIRATVLAGLVFLMVLFPALAWIREHRQFQNALFDALPLIFALVITVKLVAAAWTAIALHDRRIVSDRALIGGALCWLCGVAAIYAMLSWLAASPVFPRYLLGAIAVLLVPLVRISAAPLALAWGRQR